MAIKILKSIIFLGREQLSAAFWFLSTLFTISVLYCLFDYFIKIIVKNAKVIISIQALISVIFLIFGYYCSLHKIKLFSMDIVFSCYWLYFCGYLIAIFRKKLKLDNYLAYIITFVISFLFLFFLNIYGSIELSSNFYENPFYLLACSISGWYFLFSLAYLVKKIYFLKRFFTFIGKRTLSIVLLHLLCMKLVTATMVQIYQLPKYSIACFPVLKIDNKWWWIAYTIIGVFLPILFNVIYNMIVKYFRKRIDRTV